MLNVRAWAEKYVPRLRAARAGGGRQGDKDEENPRPTEDVPLLSKAGASEGMSKRPDDEDWSNMYNFEIPAGSSGPYTPKSKNLTLGQKIKTRFHYYIPIFSWLPKYKIKQQLLSDVLAGMGVGAMLIPQALSYSLLAGLPVSSGLLTAFVREFPIYDPYADIFCSERRLSAHMGTSQCALFFSSVSEVSQTCANSTFSSFLCRCPW